MKAKEFIESNYDHYVMVYPVARQREVEVLMDKFAEQQAKEFAEHLYKNWNGSGYGVYVDNRIKPFPSRPKRDINFIYKKWKEETQP